MSDSDSLLSTPATSLLGIQVIFWGLLLFSLGIIIGIEIVADPAFAHWADSTNRIGVFGNGASQKPPEYFRIATQFTYLAGISAVASLSALLYLDRQIAGDDGINEG